jgi:prepilin-type N-terminal cleavage/methylation domain-containing protein
MAGGRTFPGFSLIEVVLAAAIFAVAVTSVLALLPLGVRQAAAARDLQAAAGLGDAVRLEVQRRVASADYGSFAALQLVASRDGSGVRPYDSSQPAGDAYFLVDVVPYGRTPLQYAATTPLLVLSARVSWPVHAANAADAGGERFNFVFALRP